MFTFDNNLQITKNSKNIYGKGGAFRWKSDLICCEKTLNLLLLSQNKEDFLYYLVDFDDEDSSSDEEIYDKIDDFEIDEEKKNKASRLLYNKVLFVTEWDFLDIINSSLFYFFENSEKNVLTKWFKICGFLINPIFTNQITTLLLKNDFDSFLEKNGSSVLKLLRTRLTLFGFFQVQKKKDSFLVLKNIFTLLKIDPIKKNFLIEEFFKKENSLFFQEFYKIF